MPLRIGKIRPLRIGKIGTPPDWENWDPSGLAKLGPLRFGKFGTLPDWQNWDPSGLAKLGPFRIDKKKTPPDWQNKHPSGLAKLGAFWIGKNSTTSGLAKLGTLPDWDPSGFVKIASQRLSKFSPDTLPDTFSDAIMLFELTKKGVSSFPRSFRIEAKPLI